MQANCRSEPDYPLTEEGPRAGGEGVCHRTSLRWRCEAASTASLLGQEGGHCQRQLVQALLLETPDLLRHRSSHLHITRGI